jgi:hypothetical protein
MTQAFLNGAVIAEAPQDDLDKIEGNWYFPPSSVNSEFLVDSALPRTTARGRANASTSQRVKDGDTCCRTRLEPSALPHETAVCAHRRQGLSNYVAF